MKIIGISCLSIAGLFMLSWALHAVAQESCPPWAQKRLAELQQQAFQLGVEIGLTGQADPDRAIEINQEMAKLPKECVQQSQAWEGTAPDSAACSQKVHDFYQCRHEFNKKLAADANPTYTCIPPRGCSY